MSIKIYDGFKTNLNIFDIKNKLISFKYQNEQTIKDEYFKEIIKKAIIEFDCNLNLSNNNFKDILFDCHFNYIKTKSNFLFDNSISILPLSKKINLLKPHFNLSELNNKFKRCDWLIDYCYYNNSDKPDNISNRNWNKRYKDWGKAFTDNNTLWSFTGFSFNFIISQTSHLPFPPNTYEDCEYYLPDIYWRKKKKYLSELSPKISNISEYLVLDSKIQKGEYDNEIKNIKIRNIKNNF